MGGRDPLVVRIRLRGTRQSRQGRKYRDEKEKKRGATSNMSLKNGNLRRRSIERLLKRKGPTE